MSATVWQNGRMVGLPAASIPAASSAVLDARAVFDGCRLFVSRHETGRSAFTLSMTKHIERLRQSCRMLGIALPYSPLQLADAAAQVIGSTRPSQDMGLRWFVTEVDRHARDAEPIVTVFARSLAGYTKPGPYRVNFASRTRWTGHGIPFAAKTMSHYAASRNETLLAKRAGFDDCLFINQFGNVAESPRANLVFLLDDEVWSPPTGDGVLAGLTRESLRRVIERATPLRWVDRSVSVKQLASCNGVLMLSSSLGVVPVERVGPYRYGMAASQAIVDLWKSAIRNPYSFFQAEIDEFTC
ncbi:Branched-chain-amino-acid aminotransferase (plasmid) [Burkholderia sp. AD24]|nr:Branched-chain-amino-acid aminotransferase [Burkholderia sp. AD24]